MEHTECRHRGDLQNTGKLSKENMLCRVILTLSNVYFIVSVTKVLDM